MGMRPRAGCHSRDKKRWMGGRTARVIRQMDETRWWEAGEYLPTRSVKTQCSEERSDLNQKFVLWSAQGGSDHQGHEFQSKRGKGHPKLQGVFTVIG